MEEPLYLDSKYSFEIKKGVIKCSIKTITDEMLRELKCIDNYASVQEIFKIIVESKDELVNSPTLVELTNRIAKEGIQLSNLIFFERKILLISLFLLFESFYMDIILLGAFHNPDAFKTLASKFFKSSKLQHLEAAIKNNDNRSFFRFVNKYLKNHSDIPTIGKVLENIFGECFFLEQDTKQCLSDFKAVRNIVVHKNSKPTKQDYDSIKIKGVVEKNSLHDTFKLITGNSTTSLPNAITFRLNLNNSNFWEKISMAMQKFVARTGDIVNRYFDL